MTTIGGRHVAQACGISRERLRRKESWSPKLVFACPDCSGGTVVVVVGVAAAAVVSVVAMVPLLLPWDVVGVGIPWKEIVFPFEMAVW